jgi:mannose-6-phosphate isomerase-like protein (cupin superfamily)
MDYVKATRAAGISRSREQGGITMSEFTTQRLPAERTVVAPDGSDVRILPGLAGGGMAHFELGAGKVAHAVVHRTVEEIWYVISGRGEMWRQQGAREDVVALEPGVCLTIPRGTHFQFRAAPTQAVAAVAVTMPPWPGEGEAVRVPGPWTVPQL